MVSRTDVPWHLERFASECVLELVLKLRIVHPCDTLVVEIVSNREDELRVVLGHLGSHFLGASVAPVAD